MRTRTQWSRLLYMVSIYRRVQETCGILGHSQVPSLPVGSKEKRNTVESYLRADILLWVLEKN